MCSIFFAQNDERASYFLCLWELSVRHLRASRAEGRSQMGERESRGAELGTFGSEFSGTSKL